MIISFSKARIDKYFLWLIYGVILQLLFIFSSENTVLTLFFAGFLLIPILFLSKDDVLIFSVFLIPAQRYFVVNDGGITLINIYFVYLFVNCMFFSKVKIDKVFLFLIYVLFFIIVAGSLYQNNYEGVFVFAKFFLVVFVLYVMLRKDDFFFYSKFVWAYIFGSLSMILISLYLNGFSSNLRFSAGDVNDSNYIALISAVSIAILCVLYSIGKVRRVYFLLMIFLFLLSGLMTQSRSFFPMLMLVFIFYFFRSFRFIFFRSVFIFLPVVLVLAYYFITEYENIPLINNAVQRILNPASGDVSNGRVDLWYKYFDILMLDYNFFWGAGVNAYKDYNVYLVPHNFLIEDLVAFGSFGTIAFYFVFVYLFRRYVGSIKGKIYGLLPIFVFLLGSMTLHSFLGMGGIVSIVVCVLSMSLCKENNYDK